MKTTDITVNYTSINDMWTNNESMRESLMVQLKEKLLEILKNFNFNNEFIEELAKLG